MDEATNRSLARRWKTFLLKSKRNQRGQALVEYLLIFAVALIFMRVVYFNKDYGFKALLDKMMLKVGSFVELNLKSGTGNQGAGNDDEGSNSLDPFTGTSHWKN